MPTSTGRISGRSWNCGGKTAAVLNREPCELVDAPTELADAPTELWLAPIALALAAPVLTLAGIALGVASVQAMTRDPVRLDVNRSSAQLNVVDQLLTLA